MDKFIQQLGIVSIERRPEACLGCGFEHGCSTHGCAVIKTASEQLKAYRATNHTPEECAAAFEELAAYRAAEQDDKWIGVKDRLPTEADANSNFQVLANHKASSKQCWHWMSVVENPFDFTSWMPIPAPSAKAALKEQEG